MKRLVAFFIMIVALIAIDQVTKSAIEAHFYYGETYNVIPKFFNLAYVKNTGAAFGMGQNGPEWMRQIFFLALPVAFCLWVLYTMVKSIKGPIHTSIAYALIIAGAVGNLIDRFTLGYVVDMFMFYWMKEEHHFHVFNVADSCITVAAFILIYDHFQTVKEKKLQIKEG